MEVLRGVESLPLEPGPSAVTIGMFDGVHRGHQAVIGRTVEAARERGIRSVATTFDRHPREVLTHGHEPRLITTLGRRAAVDGRVVRGAGRGTGLGAPTAKLETSPRVQLPAVGVYAGMGIIGDGRHVAAINVGSNPTFGDEPVHVEAYLLDFEGDLTGRDVSIEFWERLRDEERFDSAEALVERIGDDVRRTREVVRE